MHPVYGIVCMQSKPLSRRKDDVMSKITCCSVTFVRHKYFDSCWCRNISEYIDLPLWEYVHSIQVKMTYFGSSQHQNTPGDIVLCPGAHVHSIHMKMQHFGSHWCQNSLEKIALPPGNMCTQYMWKWNISAVVGAKTLWGILFSLWCNVCTQNMWKWYISVAVGAKILQVTSVCLLGKNLHSIYVKVKYLCSCWCWTTPRTIVLPPREYLHSIRV